MKLIKFRVLNFRSIDDSGWIDIDQVTALIGTNESGKTNLMLPLWKFNPADGGEINPTADYPRKLYNEIRTKQLKPILSRLDAVILNREEASLLTNIPYEQEEKIFRRLDELVDGIAIMTDGPRGVSVSDGEVIYKSGIFKEKKIVDRTGAGDAFGSAFISALAEYEKKNKLPNKTFPPQAIEYAIRLASANATSVVEHVGAQEGILAKRDFEKNRRWKKIKIESKKI